MYIKNVSFCCLFSAQNIHCIITTCLSRSIHDPSTEILVIEVWDNDEETVGVSGIKGAKGTVR